MYTFTQQIPEDDSYQLIVAGGGPAGCAAAIAAARAGVRTLLIERSSSLGGMAGGGRVPHWHGTSNGGGFYTARGIAERIIRRMQAQLTVSVDLPMGWAIDAEGIKRIFDEELAESGADVLLETTLAAAETDGNGRVQRIIAVNKRGLCAYKAPLYLDCTGDADLIAFAGGAFEMGDEEGGVQAVTLCFLLTGIDGLPFDFETRIHLGPEHLTYSWIAPGTYCINGGHIHMTDPLDPAERSRALAQGRAYAARIAECLREAYPNVACEARLAATAEQLGVRESRRIAGLYKLTDEDYFARRSFADEIARNCSNLDSHVTPREKAILDAGGTLPHKNEEFVFAPGESHGIPYRSLVHRDLRNAAVAGRSLCADRRMMGSCRMMSVCMSMGEAMGFAASLAAQMPQPDFHAVDTDALRALLKENGAYLL